MACQKLGQLFTRLHPMNRNFYFLNNSAFTINVHTSAPASSLITTLRQLEICPSCRAKYRIEHAQNFSQVNTTITKKFTKQYSDVAPKEGMVARLWEGLGFTGKLKYRKFILKLSSLRMYLCCVELVDQDTFMKEFNLPDTFYSWFRVTELHIWMVLVRLAAEGKEGIFIRNQMVNFMWQDIDKRTRKLGKEASTHARKEGIQTLSNQLKYALFSYDEGLAKDDTVLAGAIWRTFFDSRDVDPNHVETLVCYVRKQVQYLEKQDSKILCSSGLITFLPLHGEEEDKSRTKQILREICKRY